MVETNRWDPAVLAAFRPDPMVSTFPGAIDQLATTEQLEHIATLLPAEWLAPSATGRAAQCADAVRHPLDPAADAVIRPGATPPHLPPIVPAHRQKQRTTCGYPRHRT